ncbi:polyribonucleotide nucleotidyltransferase [Candidatus Falkowbacteria bacterium]|nr:polyribonucleotide nucleotidyltransferase [Candidatus Falkowbacteria bacterium]
MQKQEIVVSSDWQGRPLTIKTGRLAHQADAAVTIQYGETVVMATVVEAKEAREDGDFFPLMVDFEERLYAAGIIKGSRWVKREGRPTDEAILSGRMIDRSIRPLFDESARRDVQVILTVLSVDQTNDYDIVALVAASAALRISGVNWRGPIGGVRVGRIDGQLIYNPTYEQRETSDLDLIVAGTAEKVIMIEAGAQEIPETEMLAAILAGQEALRGSIDLIEQLYQAVGPIEAKKSKTVRLSAEEVQTQERKQQAQKIAEQWLSDHVEPILFDKVYYTKGQRKLAVEAIKDGLDEYLFSQSFDKSLRHWVIGQTVETAVENAVTKNILQSGRRVDGRALDEIRELSADVSILPRNHGVGLFSRGETQVMSIVTLGAPSDEQSLEGLEGVSTKSYMHHYNFAPYCTGEAKPIRTAGRREVGHGALAEKALVPVLPSKADFPYTIRVVSETLSSNGSSSMGSTCASSLSLMDAGVPIKRPVAGIAMGLASNQDMSQWKVLTDIQDLEDGQGGMDFKITGTTEGITAIQLDTKTDGLNKDIIETTINQSRQARLQILEVMNKSIAEPRAELSPYAPKIVSFFIDAEKIREVIGAGGKIINEIIAACEVTIDIEQTGQVMICGSNQEKLNQAVKWVQDIARKLEIGEEFTGEVVRLLDFGAFVELLPNRDGMVHASELAPFYVGRPSDMLQEGDTVTVKIKAIDEQGRVNLTMKDLPANQEIWERYKAKGLPTERPAGFSGPRSAGSRPGDNSGRPRFR